MNLALNFWAFNLFMIFTFTLSHQLYQSAPMIESSAEETHSAVHNYARFSEVERSCKHILSSASKLEFDHNRINALKPELSFIKGDWKQDSGHAPLMPFDASDAHTNPSNQPEPIHLSTFTLTHVDLSAHSHIAINVSGALGIGISRNGTTPDSGHSLFPEFRIWPGSSELRILFEGVYVESKNNGGERVLCLVGDAMLPSRQPESNNNQPAPLLRDNQILLVLWYPKMFTLTTRAVHGEMSSLNEENDIKFFDKVRFTSQLGAYSTYEFGDATIVSRACMPYPYQDDGVIGGDGLYEIYRGNEFCEMLDQFVSGEVLDVVPNWNCNSTDEYCSKLGPFESVQEIRATDGGFSNVRLVMQDVRCEPSSGGPKNVSSARVSAVFRAIPPWESHHLASQRSGLNGMTLSAEGIWGSLVGQLCMIGCVGLGHLGCQSRICLYFPTSFSIKQRNIVFGKISSIDNSGNASHYPLSFERPIHPLQFWNKYGGRLPLSSYKYSKIKLAGAFLERSRPFDFGSTIKKSILSYPKVEGDGDELVNLSNLSDDLTLHVPAVPDPLPEVRAEKPFLQLEVLSLGSLFGRYWAFQNQTDEVTVRSPLRDSSTEQQLLLNVSAELALSGESYKNVSVLYLEGLYSPVDGKMYLIACRDARAAWKILFDSMDLEDGLDCLIEVKVEYPPTTARWLMNPTAKVSITSQRSEDDPLHFRQIKLQTLPILYREQREDILSRRGVEGVLRVLTLSLAITCILSQLFYVRAKPSFAPFISLVMLGVQALGYSIPLITGAEALFSRISSESYGAPSYELENKQWFEVLDYIVKILILGAFLLTLRLGQKVWKSRIRLLTRSPLEPWRVPNDKKVLAISFSAHLVGFLAVLVVHRLRPATYIDSRVNSHGLRGWGLQLEEYVGLVQDFFLLPQIIGNVLWKIDCKPLRKAYYVGITVVRLLPHVYDYIRAPVFNPYFSEEYEFVNPSLDFYSKFGDVAIPATAAMLAAVIYVQQRWSYQKLSQSLRWGQKKLLPLGSTVYERLPSLSFEAELVSGANEISTQEVLES